MSERESSHEMTKLNWFKMTQLLKGWYVREFPLPQHCRLKLKEVR